MAKSRSKILLLGYGDVNQRLSKLLISDGTHNNDVIAVRRSAMEKPAVTLVNADISDTKQLKSIFDKHKPNKIVLTISPSEYSEQGYRESYLKVAENILVLAEQITSKPEILFISSSSVWHQNSGELIDEESPCAPSRYNGRVLLEAEQVLLNSKQVFASVIRFSGIYGPGRYRLIKRSLNSKELASTEIRWTNRIHAQDCARAIQHILNIPLQQRQQIYLASDSLPVEKHKVMNWIRSRFKSTDVNKKSTDAQRKSHDSDQITSHTGKRYNNARLLESGFNFSYPTYKEGFSEILIDYKTENNSY